MYISHPKKHTCFHKDGSKYPTFSCSFCEQEIQARTTDCFTDHMKKNHKNFVVCSWSRCKSCKTIFPLHVSKKSHQRIDFGSSLGQPRTREKDVHTTNTSSTLGYQNEPCKIPSYPAHVQQDSRTKLTTLTADCAESRTKNESVTVQCLVCKTNLSFQNKTALQLPFRLGGIKCRICKRKYTPSCYTLFHKKSLNIMEFQPLVHNQIYPKNPESKTGQSDLLQMPEFRCETCNILFCSDNFLQRHYRIEHHPCQSCKKIFSANDLLKHYQGDPRFPCEICSIGLSNCLRVNHYESHKYNALKCKSLAEFLHIYSHLQKSGKFPKAFTCLACWANNPGSSKSQFNNEIFNVQNLTLYLNHLISCWKKRLEMMSFTQTAHLLDSRSFAAVGMAPPEETSVVQLAQRPNNICSTRPFQQVGKSTVPPQPTFTTASQRTVASHLPDSTTASDYCVLSNTPTSISSNSTGETYTNVVDEMLQSPFDSATDTNQSSVSFSDKTSVTFSFSKSKNQSLLLCNLANQRDRQSAPAPIQNFLTDKATRLAVVSNSHLPTFAAAHSSSIAMAQGSQAQNSQSFLDGSQTFKIISIQDDQSKRIKFEFMCKSCDVDLGKIEFLRSHCQVEHFQCKACSKMFTQDGLKNHYLLEPHCKLTVANNSPCEICGTRLTIENRLRHYKVHEDRLGLFSCFFCTDKFVFFNSRELMDAHVIEKHTGSNYFTCVCCQIKFAVKCSNTTKIPHRKYLRKFLDHLKTCWMHLIDSQSEVEQYDFDLDMIDRYVQKTASSNTESRQKISEVKTISGEETKIKIEDELDLFQQDPQWNEEIL